MELVEGESLSTLLARAGRSSPDRTLDVLRQTAAALAVAHAAGVVHRDVKPGNVLVRLGRHGEDHRLRHRLVGRQRAAHPDRPGHRHRRLPLPGAGRRRARHPGQRRLRARHGRLRVPGRPAAPSTATTPSPSRCSTSATTPSRCPTTSRPACARWSSGPSSRTPRSGSPTAPRSSRRSTGCRSRAPARRPGRHRAVPLGRASGARPAPVAGRPGGVPAAAADGAAGRLRAARRDRRRPRAGAAPATTRRRPARPPRPSSSRPSSSTVRTTWAGRSTTSPSS